MNSSMKPARSIRSSSLKQGSRGWVTSLAPPVQILTRVRVDGLAIAAVDAPVGLIVARDVDAAHRDATADRILLDARADDLTFDDDLAWPSDVHRGGAALMTTHRHGRVKFTSHADDQLA